MNAVDIRQRAVRFRNCGLPGDAELLDALADVCEAAYRMRSAFCTIVPELKKKHVLGVCECLDCKALARVEALKP